MIVILLVACVLFSASIHNVKAQTTTISNVTYPSQVVLQNGVAQATVTFTLGYSDLPSGDALFLELMLESPVPQNPQAGVPGSVSSTPDPCPTSWNGKNWSGEIGCAYTPSASSGTESVTFTIKSPASPQQYTFEIVAVMVDPSTNNEVQSSVSHQTFTISVVAAATDWAVLSISLSPPNPKVGDLVTFSMVVTAVSSQESFPQQFGAVCQIDGASCGSGTFTYPGPVGTPMTVSTQTPWTATSGPHTLTWGVATIPVGQDPDKSNNAMSKSFTVAQIFTSTTTTPEYQNFVLPVFASLTVVIIVLARKAGKLP